MIYLYKMKSEGYLVRNLSLMKVPPNVITSPLCHSFIRQFFLLNMKAQTLKMIADLISMIIFDVLNALS